MVFLFLFLFFFNFSRYCLSNMIFFFFYINGVLVFFFGFGSFFFLGEGGRLARVEKLNSNIIREIQETKLTKKNQKNNIKKRLNLCS